MKDGVKNILVICSDQHNKRITGCYGNTKAQTPNLDRLAGRGVIFDNAYTACPICMPARAALVTGRYPFRGRYWDNAHPYDGELPSFGGILEQHGIEITTIGKLHFKDASPRTGFARQLIPMHAAKGGIGEPTQCLRNNGVLKPQQRDGIVEAGAGDSDYLRYDRRITETAVDFLRGKAGEKDGKPWAAYVGFVNPHPPYIAPPEFYDRFDENSLPLPVQYHMEQRPRHPVLEGIRRFNDLQDELSETVIRKMLKTYYAKTAFLDEQVGRVMRAVEDCGLEEDTLIIYTSDHGDNLGNHGLWYKQTMYEESAGIPLIAAGPGIPAGERRGTITTITDIFATIMDYADITAESDGKSLRQVFKGTEEERTAFSEFHCCGAIEDVYMIRRGWFKYVYYMNCENQLFDLENDPRETVNLAGREQYREAEDACQKALFEILNPVLTDRECRRDQEEIVNMFGGRAAFSNGVVWKGIETPVPEEYITSCDPHTPAPARSDSCTVLPGPDTLGTGYSESGRSWALRRSK